MQPFRKLESWNRARRRFIRVVDNNFKQEILFDEDIIRTVNNILQYQDDQAEVNTTKITHPKEIKALELARRYVGQC